MGMPPACSTVSRKCLLLVVEDEPLLSDYMRLALSRDGYDVLTALNAEDAWALFQREGLRVRAVVTDAVMPGALNGLELGRRVRATVPATPVLLVTGYPLPAPLDPRCALLRKPFTR